MEAAVAAVEGLFVVLLPLDVPTDARPVVMIPVVQVVLVPVEVVAGVVAGEGVAGVVDSSMF